MRDIKSDLTKLLKADDTQERCGFVTKRGRIVHVKNVAENPEEAFKIAPEDTIKWAEKSVATWHTHPKTTANLSGEDYNCFLVWDNLVHYIIGRLDGKVEVATYSVDDGLMVRA